MSKGIRTKAPKRNPGAEDSSLEVRETVHRILLLKSEKGEVKAYNGLVQEIRSLKAQVERQADKASVQILVNLIKALTACISVVRERKHEALVSETLGIQLWGCPELVGIALLDFISNLVVVNSAFTHTCLQVLIYSFLPPPAPPSEEAEKGPWSPEEKAKEVQSKVVTSLAKVLALVPTAPSIVLPLVVQHMPHKLRDRATQCLYLQALFDVAELPAGAPIREGVLAAVVEHLLTVDVEIRWEDIVDTPTGQEAEEYQSDEEQDIFELEGLDLNDSDERELTGADRGGWEGAGVGRHARLHDSEQPGEAVGVVAAVRPPVDLTANKLDSMMELTFQHLERRCNAGELMCAWDTLLGAFERAVLNTHRSKFTQFLLFYLASREPATTCAALTTRLLNILQDVHVPPITRCACAAYLASFLARAAFLPDSLLLETLQKMAAFCQSCATSIMAELSRAGLRPPTAPLSPGSNPKHQVFYSSVQALLYVLCYHLETLMATPITATPAAKAGLKQQPGDSAPEGAAAVVATLVKEQVWPLLTHPLAPLSVCLPSVASEFSHQAAALGLCDCTPLLAPDDSSHARPARPLEMFFPFDPYLLPRSSRFLALKTSYIRWKRGHPRQAGMAGAAAAAGNTAHARENDDDEDDEDDSYKSDDESASVVTYNGAESDSDDDDDDVDATSSRGGASPMACSLPSASPLPPQRLKHLPPHHPHPYLTPPSSQRHHARTGSPLNPYPHHHHVAGHTHMGSIEGGSPPYGMSPDVLVNYTSPMSMTPDPH